MICPHCKTKSADDVKKLACPVCNIPYETTKLRPAVLAKLKENMPFRAKKNLEDARLKALEARPVQVVIPQEAKNSSNNQMGNFMFMTLHVMAVLFGFVGLFITIPTHIIYLAVLNKK